MDDGLILITTYLANSPNYFIPIQFPYDRDIEFYNSMVCIILAEINNLYYIPIKDIGKDKGKTITLYILGLSTKKLEEIFIFDKDYINASILKAYVLLNPLITAGKFRTIDIGYISSKLNGLSDINIRGQCIHVYVTYMPQKIKTIFNKTVKINKQDSYEQIYNKRFQFIKKYDNFNDFNTNYNNFINKTKINITKIIRSNKFKVFYQKYIKLSRKVKFDYKTAKKSVYYTKSIHNKLNKFCKSINYKL